MFRNAVPNNYTVEPQHEIEKGPEFNGRPEVRIQSPSQNEDGQSTKLLQTPANSYFTYNRVPWKLNIRKEVSNAAHHVRRHYRYGRRLSDTCAYNIIHYIEIKNDLVFCCFCQVFTPKESMSSPLILHLIFCQIVSDMFNKFHSVHARISADEREEMLDVRIIYVYKIFFIHFEPYESIVNLLKLKERDTSHKTISISLSL